jgi:hypothetical protein
MSTLELALLNKSMCIMCFEQCWECRMYVAMVTMIINNVNEPSN